MGSGGNFLHRVLTLSEKTIPLIQHVDTTINQVEYQLSASSRFSLYNHFDPVDWRTSEFSLIMQYTWGQNDFVKYEKSNRYLIANWHPREFLLEDQKQLLWPSGSWPHLIFITTTPEDMQFLNTVGIRKNYPPNTKEMINSMTALQDKYHKTSINIPFSSMLVFDTFIKNIKLLDKILKLNLEMDLVKQLWESWIYYSRTCWFNTSEFQQSNTYGFPWEPKITKHRGQDV